MTAYVTKNGIDYRIEFDSVPAYRAPRDCYGQELEPSEPAAIDIISVTPDGLDDDEAEAAAMEEIERLVEDWR